jgi:hypothetical protein
VLGSEELKDVLSAVGDLLEAQGERVGIVVVGGASLNLLGIVERTTGDVDVIATVRSSEDGPGSVLVPPDPVPESLAGAIRTVARDFDLPPDWMNTEIGAQWEISPPPRLEEDLTWREFGGLRVGLAGRRTLIALKLFAAVDQGPESVHYQDLIALGPTEKELEEAAEWVRAQDVSPVFVDMIEQVVRHVQQDTT